MVRLTYILILELYSLVFGHTTKDCPNAPPEETFQSKLAEKLLQCGYSKFDPPKGPNSQLTTVNVKFRLRYFSLNSDTEVLILQSWVLMSWTDSRLEFNTAEYGDLEVLELESYNIWTPSFRIYNSADSVSDIDKDEFLPCSIKHTGSVNCASRSAHFLYCNIRLSDYPYDAQTCHFIYGAMDPTNSYNVSYGSRAMTTLDAEYGSTWFISDVYQHVLNKRLNLTLVFEREALSLAAVIVYPALIISSLSIACLFLDARLTERLLLTCLSILCHFYWLQELSTNLPKQIEDPPRILMYYRGSLIITVLILFITFLFSLMCRKERAPHNFIIFTNKLVYGTYARFLMYPRWDVPHDSQLNEDWTKFANSLNSLCIKVIIFCYIGLYVAFIPQPIPFNL